MRVLVAGDWYSDVHEEGVYQAYKALGHVVFSFKWYQYFLRPSDSGTISSYATKFLNKFQDKFILGPVIARINYDLIKKIDDCRPDLVSIYRGTHITKSTLRIIKRNHPNILLVSHNEDDPFTKNHPLWLWRHFLNSIPEYDLVLAHRLRNVDEYTQIGARNVRFLRSWYSCQRNYPVKLSPAEKLSFDCDVVFVGHYENDGRIKSLEEIIKGGYKLKLFGPGKYWDPVLLKSPLLNYLVPVQPVWGNEYNKALCGAKVALCFLSKLNHDTYTRRCFEIPATKTLLLSEFSDELSTLYLEGVEAEFFKSNEELLKKLKLYVNNQTLRESVARAGYNRAIFDGHDVVSRIRQVVSWVLS